MFQNGVTSIGNYAFQNCTRLTSLMTPGSVASIGSWAFYDCTSLASVIIPGSVTNIGSYAFYDCYSLTNVAIINGVASIGNGAFLYCTNLASVTIPSSISSIGSSAFYGCTNLTTIYCQGNAPSAGNNTVFSGDPGMVYYLPGTTGWGATYPTNGGLPTALWTLPYPLALTSSPNFGVRRNRFGFTISWATNVSVVVEACTNLASPVWQPLQTNALVNGTNYFSDANWTNNHTRFYRIHSP
jgi:hypothetical protein